MKHVFFGSRAQNIIEYIVLFVAVVLVLLSFLRSNGSYSRAVNNLLNQPGSMLDAARSRDFR